MKLILRAGLASLALGAGFAADAPAPAANPGLPKQSPFVAQNIGGGPAAASETIELAGVSTIGRKTDLIIYDKTAKKSHWIAQGETKDGIAVVSYDVTREQAIVRVNGVEKVLQLRKVTGPANGPRPVATQPTGFNLPTPGPAVMPAVTDAAAANVASAAPAAQTPPAPAPAPAQPPAPETAQAKQETEARMLVSDLLEIGMAQRRAYEEAQRKAASGTPQTPPADPNANATPKP